MDDKGNPFQNNLFSNHFLKERLSELEDWGNPVEDKFDEIKKQFEDERENLESGANEHQTQNKFIDEVLDILGHHHIGEEETEKSGEGLNPDYLFIKDSEQEKQINNSDSTTFFDEAIAVGDAKRWGAELDRGGTDHSNPAFQIYNYVDRLRIKWGILTNGKRWRLYCYDDCEADIFYEVNLVEDILKEEDREKALERFRYFYLFFRQGAFLPEDDGFADRVFDGSVSYSKDLEQDLEDRIYKALKVASKGFFASNNIDKNPENIDTVHRSSLILLYRILFILNAESRGLLPVDNDHYYDNLSLQKLNERLLDDPNQGLYMMWETRIKHLFEVIDKGRNDDQLTVTAYNGGLFRGEDSDWDVREENQFLSQNDLDGEYLGDILKLLSQSKDEETDEIVLVDYRDLNIRHLGSVYEGLLEHDLKKAKDDLILDDEEWEKKEDADENWEDVDADDKVEKGDLYLTNESGERKATGSYYTPEFVVEHIVKKTVEPKIEEKISEAENDKEKIEKVLELDICDPAMGSGHFLTEATSYIAHRVMEEIKELPQAEEAESEIVWLKRQITRRCIYGVDVNPLATELAKLSLWIETMSKGKPLSFLDHHLKVGNSLVGVGFQEALTYPYNDAQKSLENERIHLDDPHQFKENLMEEYMKLDRMEESTKKEVEVKERTYKKFVKENDLYRRFLKLANVHINQYFTDEPVDQTTYENILVSNIGTSSFESFQDDSWFVDAQEKAESMYFFHWELEYPQIFFGENEGFDAVVGNPPYISTSTSEGHSGVFEELYDTAEGKYDLYSLFVERSWNLTSEDGLMSFILPNKFFRADYGESLRELIGSKVESITDFRSNQIFDSATTYTCILTLGNSSETTYESIASEENLIAFRRGDRDRVSVEDYHIQVSEGRLNSEEWELERDEVLEVLDKIDQKKSIGEKESLEAYDGLRTNGDKVLLFEVLEEKENSYLVKSKFLDQEFEFSKDYLQPCLKGSEVKDYFIEEVSNVVLYPYTKDDELINEDKLRESSPNLFEYLNKEEVKDELESRRGSFSKYYELTDPRTTDKFEDDKVVLQTLSKLPKTTTDRDNLYFVGGGTAGAKGLRSKKNDYDLHSLCGYLNSSLTGFYLIKRGSEFNNNYYAFSTSLIQELGLPADLENIDKKAEKLSKLVPKVRNTNTNPISFIGDIDFDKALIEVATPVEEVEDKLITETSDQKENLEVVDIRVNGSRSPKIQVKLRYKPVNPSKYKTDQYGYTRSRYIDAFKIVSLDEDKLTFLEQYLKAVVDKGGGYADFRCNATTRDSPLARLKELKLPHWETHEKDIERHKEVLDEWKRRKTEIENLRDQIDISVYNKFDLDEDEKEIVKEAVKNAQK